MILTSTSSCSPAASTSATNASRTFIEPANTQAVPAQTETRRLPPTALTATRTPPSCGLAAGAACSLIAVSPGAVSGREPELLDQRLDDLARLVGAQVAVGVLVYAHDRRLRTGAHAGHRVVAELHVVGRAAVGDPELLRDRLRDARRAGHVAGGAVAHADLVAAARDGAELGVERDDAVDARGGHAAAARAGRVRLPARARGRR